MSNQQVHEAAREGDAAALAQQLKARPTDVDLRGEIGYTPLMFAAREGKLEAVKLLIEHKGRIGQANDFGLTALHFACGKGHAEIAALLLDNGAGMTASDKSGQSPLMHAVYNNKPECVKLLLERKADPTQKATTGRRKGDSAFDIAEEMHLSDLLVLMGGKVGRVLCSLRTILF